MYCASVVGSRELSQVKEGGEKGKEGGRKRQKGTADTSKGCNYYSRHLLV